jgi:hypothetical protein
MSPLRHPDLPGDGVYCGAETTGFVSPASDHIEGLIYLTDVLLGQLVWREGQWFLRSGRADRMPLALTEDAEVWAVVMSLVRERL